MSELVRLDFRVSPHLKAVLEEWCEAEGINKTQYLCLHFKELERKLNKRKKASRK